MREGSVGRYCLAFAAFALLSVSPASAQFSDVITACRWDSKQACAGVLPDGGALARCIAEHFAALDPSCQAALVRISAVRDACRADAAQQCPGIKPGAGHLLLCVKQHYAALSAPCRDAIGHAAERNARGH